MEDAEEKVQEVTEEVTTPPGRVVRSTTHKVVQKPAVKTEHPQRVYETKKSIFRTYQIVWYVLGFFEILLLFRLVLKILAANPGSGFSILIYGLSGPLVAPFVGVLRITTADTGSTFEWPTLIATAVYWVVAYGIVKLLQLIKPVSQQEIEETVDSV